jgi:hypothetical protein
VEALSKRYEDAHVHANTRGILAEFVAFTDAVRKDSHVVVAMPTLKARMFLRDPRELYANYEALVGTHARTPAPFVQDADRCSVSGRLFGSYAPQISYGVLSLDGRGLANYGIVFLRLRDIAVMDRVSFLQENSFLFLAMAGVGPRSELPSGYRSDWAHRGELAATKLEPVIFPGNAFVDWARLLVVSGSDRSQDRCIEAHIFGPFNADSVDTVLLDGVGRSREERNDIATIQEIMSKQSSIGEAH